MTKLTLLSGAVARASAVLGACLLARACPAVAFTPSSSSKAGGENTPLNLTSPSTGHTTSSGGASLVRTIVGLAIVIAVIWGLSWMLRQVKSGKRREAHPSSAGLASVSALTLGSGRSVHLVRAGNDYVLLGATEHGVAPIHRYSEEQARAAGLFEVDRFPYEAPSERSRVLTAASQLVAGAGRAASAGRTVVGRTSGLGERTDLGSFSTSQRISGHSPVVGVRPDPMRMPPNSVGLIDRLRELTVRR